MSRTESPPHSTRDLVRASAVAAVAAAAAFMHFAAAAALEMMINSNGACTFGPTTSVHDLALVYYTIGELGLHNSRLIFGYL